MQPPGQEIRPHRKRRQFAQPLEPARSALEWAAMVLLLLPSVGGMWYFGGSRVVTFAPPLILAALGMILFWLRLFLFVEVDRLRAPPGGWSALALAAMLVVWIPFAAVRYDAVLHAVKAVSAVAAYWLWADLAGHQRRWRWLLGALVFSVTLMGCYALIQHMNGSNLVLDRPRPETYGMRASGAFICPNHFASLVVMALCVCIALIASRGTGGALRILCLYACLVLLPTLYLTQSRSGWLGLLAGGAVVAMVLAWRSGTRRFALTMLIAPMVLALIAFLAWEFLPLVRERIEAALRGDMRPRVWADTWSMVLARPWFGWGPGSFRWIFPSFRERFTDYYEPRYSHNEYLDALAETGAIGLVLLLLPYIRAAVALFRRVRGEGREREAALAAAALGALAGTAVHAVFDFNLQMFANLQSLVLIGGVAVSAQLASGGEPARPPSRLVPRLGAVIGMLVALGLIVATARAWQAWVLNERGQALREELRPEDARRVFERALRWDAWLDRPYVELGEIDRRLAFWARDPDEKAAAAERALRRYTEAERLNPWEPDARFGRYKVLDLLGRREEATAELQEIVRRLPHHPYYLTQWGARLSDLGRYPEAIAAFTRAEQISPSPMGRNYLAWLQERMRDKAAGEKP